MRARRASRTAGFTAMVRALGQTHPPEQRIFNDPLARDFVPGAIRRRFFAGRRRLARRLEGPVAYLASREKFADDVIKRAIQQGTDQVVLLAAGFESTAFRIGELHPDVRFFEVDHPATQSVKQQRVARLGLNLDRRTRFVSCDFERNRINTRLLEEGLDPQRPTVFKWIGVSYYLSETAVRQTLSDVRSLMADGSTIVFDYFVDGGFEQVVSPQLLRVLGESSGFVITPSEAERLLHELGLDITQQASATDLMTQDGAVGLMEADLTYLACASPIESSRPE